MLRSLFPALFLLAAALAGCASPGTTAGSQAPVAACSTCPSISIVAASIESRGTYHLADHRDGLRYWLALRVQVDNRQGPQDFGAYAHNWVLVNSQGQVAQPDEGDYIYATAGSRGPEGNLSTDLYVRGGPWAFLQYTDANNVATKVPIPTLTWPKDYGERYVDMTVKSAVREASDLMLQVAVRNPIDAPVFKWCVNNESRVVFEQAYDQEGRPLTYQRAGVDCANAPDVAAGTDQETTLRLTPPTSTNGSGNWHYLNHQNAGDAGAEATATIPQY